MVRLGLVQDRVGVSHRHPETGFIAQFGFLSQQYSSKCVV